MVHAALGRDWDCLFANDISPKKAAAYVANWGRGSLKVGDIAQIAPNELPGRADLAWASFPCQDLSVAGNGAGLDGNRSGLFWPFIELMRRLKAQRRTPRIIAVENVCGAITSSGGKDFQSMIGAVAREGYLVGAMVIDAIHFLPQSRPRLFIIAVDSSVALPNELKSRTASPAWHPASIVKAYNQLDGVIKDKWVWWNMPMPRKRLKTLDEVIEVDPGGVDWHSKLETQRLFEMMSPVNRQKVLLAQASGRLRVGTVYRRTRDGVQRAEVRFDGVAGCLRTPGGGSSRQTILVVDRSAIRSRLLSPREAARLMGLKDSYQLPDRYNDAYHLAGDGVCVPVVSHLAKHIFDVVVESVAATTVAKAA